MGNLEYLSKIEKKVIKAFCEKVKRKIWRGYSLYSVVWVKGKG